MQKKEEISLYDSLALFSGVSSDSESKTTSKSLEENVASSKDEWKKMPIDNVGYFSQKDLCLLSDSELKSKMDQFIATRNDPNAWRNYGNKWRALLTDHTTHKTILDYGSGLGIEAREFLIQSGNQVYLADIHEENMEAAERVLSLYNCKSSGHILLSFDEPFFDHQQTFDIFYSNGVLHHTPKMRSILQRACQVLKPDTAEIRLMVYSDEAWKAKTNTPVDIDTPVEKQSGFGAFVRQMDDVGVYADFYNREKMNRLVGDFLEIVRCEYITSNDQYIVFIMKPKKTNK